MSVEQRQTDRARGSGGGRGGEHHRRSASYDRGSSTSAVRSTYISSHSEVHEDHTRRSPIGYRGSDAEAKQQEVRAVHPKKVVVRGSGDRRQENQQQQQEQQEQEQQQRKQSALAPGVRSILAAQGLPSVSPSTLRPPSHVNENSSVINNGSADENMTTLLTSPSPESPKRREHGNGQLAGEQTSTVSTTVITADKKNENATPSSSATPTATIAENTQAASISAANTTDTNAGGTSPTAGIDNGVGRNSRIEHDLAPPIDDDGGHFGAGGGGSECVRVNGGIQGMMAGAAGGVSAAAGGMGGMGVDAVGILPRVLVDVSFESQGHNGQAANQLVKDLIDGFPALRPLALLLKQVIVW